MKLYRYWASSERAIQDSKGKPVLLKKWGGSNGSAEDAAVIAKRAVNALAERLLAQPDFRRWPWKNTSDEYGYGARDLPEELIDSLDANNGITRNRYGCLVVNTSTAMFVDIDFPRPSFGQRFGTLFGKKLPDPQKLALDRLKDWLLRHSGIGVRIYKTAAGLRYLFTDTPRAADANTLLWMDELGSDPLYRRLCKSQQCFRARLTPKPWRLKMTAPSSHYPRTDAQLASFRLWLTDYENKSKNFAACTLLEHWGNRDINADLAPLVTRHDASCRAETSLPLA